MDPDQPKTTLLNDDWASSFDKKCSCGRDLLALFYCNVETCPDYEQIFFCNDCSMIDDKHMHKKV